jgi:nitric oxide synthase oxygenase domain/subunit
MYGGPDTRLRPIAQTPPAGHAAATAKFNGHQPPRDAAFEDEHDAGQAVAIRHPWSTARRLGWLGRQQRFDFLPQRFRNQWLSHDCLLAAEERPLTYQIPAF